MFHFIAALDERRWPSGDYSILMSKYGCPDPDINDWKHGYVNISFGKDIKLEGVDNLMGPFSRRNFQLTFCTMIPDENDWIRDVTADWPHGNFSVFEGHSCCPDGKRGMQFISKLLAYILQAFFLWDIGKQCRPRSDAADRGV